MAVASGSSKVTSGVVIGSYAATSGKTISNRDATSGKIISNHDAASGKTALQKMLMLVFAFFMAVSVSQAGIQAAFANSEIDPAVQVDKGNTVVAYTIQQINQKVQTETECPNGFLLYTYNESSGMLSWNSGGFQKLVLTDKREAMKIALKSISASSMPTTTKTKIYNFTCDQDTGISQALRWASGDASADVAGAAGVIAPLNRTIGTVWGVLCITILIFMAFSCTVDVAFLTLPPLRQLMSNGKKHYLVSLEAVQALKEAESSDKNALVCYLRRRVVAMFVISTIIIMIITGKIWEPFFFLGNAFF